MDLGSKEKSKKLNNDIKEDVANSNQPIRVASYISRNEKLQPPLRVPKLNTKNMRAVLQDISRIDEERGEDGPVDIEILP